MEWSFALFLSLLALAVILHHFGIRRLSREAPALLAMGPALIMLLAWLLLILSSIGSLGLLVIPAAIAAGVPFLLLARSALRVINASRADQAGLVDSATIDAVTDAIVAETLVTLFAGLIAAIVLIVLLAIRSGAHS
jgi:hypothetical protein